MNDLFNILFKRLAIWWLPTFLRKPVMNGYIEMLIYPLDLMFIEFKRWRKQHLIKMEYNYQKFSIQKRLNNLFDPLQRRIKIVSAIQYNGIYLYTEAEDDAFYNKTKWLYDDQNPIYLRTEAELFSEYDFIVEVPNIPLNFIRMAAEIDFYKLPSKRYKIEII